MTNRDDKGRFIKGQTGNPHGRPPVGFSVTEIIRARVAERPTVVDKLFDAIDRGEAWAIQYAIDRIDGKPKQATEVTGAGGGPVEWLTMQRELKSAIESGE